MGWMSALLILSPTRWAPEERAGFPEVPPAQLAPGSPWLIAMALAVALLLVMGIIVLGRRRRRRNLRGAHFGSGADQWDRQRRAPNRGRRRTPLVSAVVVRRDGAKALDELIGLRPELYRALHNDGIELAWPSQPRVGQDGGLIDCSCERIPARFLQAGTSRTLDRAIGSDMSHADRVQLLRQVARFLHELHRRGWAFGAVRWDSFLYCEGAKPSLLVRNAEFARRLGDEPAFARQSPARSRDDDHGRGLDAFPSLRDDRYCFSLMVQQLLGAKKLGQVNILGLDSVRDGSVDGECSHLLLAGVEAGRLRPFACEWLVAFDEPVFTIRSSEHSARPTNRGNDDT